MTTPPQSVRPRWARVLGWIALGLAVVLVITVAGGVLIYKHLSGNIKHGCLHAKSCVAITEPRKLGRSQNILLIGSDTRAFAGGSKFGAEVGGARSDTTILVHLSASGRKAILVSIPRDSWVQIPSCRLPRGGVSAPQMNKFNYAYSLGGHACTIATVESLTGIRIDHYVEVNFLGFQHMVDALGGVDVCLTHSIYDPIRFVDGHYEGSGLSLPAGNDHLNGTNALKFVRARYGVGDGSDLGRIKNQQLFLSAVIRKASSAGLLLDPLKLYRFLDAATKSIETDPGFGLRQLRHLADALHGLKPGKVVLLTVPLDLNAPGVPSADVAWDATRAPLLWDALKRDGPLPGTAPRTRPTPTPSMPPLVVAPSHVRVRVLNGTGRPNVAAQVAAQLRSLGFDVIGTGDADSSSYATTVVRYGTDRVESSETLAAAVTGSTRQLDGSLSGSVELVVGANYAGAHPVTVANTTTGTPTPTPTATIESVTAETDVCST